MAPSENVLNAQAGEYFNAIKGESPDELNGNPDSSRRSSNEGRPLNETQPKAKRIACVLCRKRKLKCDGTRPSCNTCKRLAHDCQYDEIRKKSGPKRGYVKLLEARLQQVETLLKTQDPPQPQRAAPKSKTANPQSRSQPQAQSQSQSFPPPSPTSTTIPISMRLGTEPVASLADFSMPTNTCTANDFSLPNITPNSNDFMNDFPTNNLAFQDTTMADEFAGESFPWEMIGLGLEEPLPAQDVIDDLHRIYFEKVQPSCPIIHRPRYLATCNLPHQMRPPIALRYAMWTLAASVTDRYEGLADHFYMRTRKYLQADEMRNHGEGIVSLQHCQAWVITCIYEFKNMYFPRAWQTTGRAVRMAQMLGLHRVDGFGLDVKQCLPPPKDWVEREERRRTFWMAFCEDRYASVGTGWPMTIDERDIMTNLPASDEAFHTGVPEQSYSLEQALKPLGSAKLSSIGGVTVMSCMFGRNLLHLHRPSPDDNDDDLNGEFWRRHRRIEGILSHTALSLPDHLRLPTGLADPNVVFMNMAIHTSAICLHQAAIFKADRHKLPPNVGSESRVRCVTAAAEIARIMRMLSHLDLSNMNPFLAFCLYVAARVFIQYLKFRPKDEQMTSSLQFLLAAMHALKKKNPLTESFLVQLDVDLEGMNIDLGISMESTTRDTATRARMCEITSNEALDCSPLIAIREGPNPASAINQFSRPTAYSTGLPLEPNGVNGINVDFSMATSADSPSYQLPQRQRSTQYGLPGAVTRVTSVSDSQSPSASDHAPSPANDRRGSSRTASTKDASSHSSLTPSSTTNASDTNGLHQIPGQTPGVYGAGFFQDSNNVVDNNFANFPPEFFGQPAGAGADFTMNNFDMSGVDMGAPTGMTPMASDSDWNQILEDMSRFADKNSAQNSARNNGISN